MMPLHRIRLVTVACIVMQLAATSGALAAQGEWEDLEFVGEATLGLRLYFPEAPFDTNELTSFFDQYHYIRNKDDVSVFGSILRLDLGAIREDGTAAFQFEWSNPWALNERATLDIDLGEFDVEIDYSRFRTGELRRYPVGTDQDGGLGLVPVFGTYFNPDQGPDDPLGLDAPFYVRRTHLGGEIRHRAASRTGLGAVLPEIRLFAGNEWRYGWRQDRFLLDAAREPTTQATARFRGNRRNMDQQATRGGTHLVLGSTARFTGSLDLAFEAFRENAATVTLGALSAGDPRIQPSGPTQAARAFNYVPDTNRLNVTLRGAGDAGPVRLEGSFFVTHLEQTGDLSPQQDLLDLPENDLTTFSLHGNFEVPLPAGWSVDGFIKYVDRSHDVDSDVFDEINPPNGQVDPFLRRRQEVRGEIEASYRAIPGTRLDGGYRILYVDRDLRFADGPGAISPALNLQEPETLSHEVFVRGRTRLLRRTQLLGELGYTRSPHVSFPRDFEDAVHFAGQVQQQFVTPIPISATVFGNLEYGHSYDLPPLGTSSAWEDQRKYTRTRWDVGLNLSALPTESLTLFSSVVFDSDQQDFTYIRSTVPRTFPPASVEFFLDSEPNFESDVLTVVLGGSQALGSQLDLSLVGSYTRVDLGFAGRGNTPSVLDDVGGLRDQIFSVDTRLRYRPLDHVSLELGYRFDDFQQAPDRAPISLDTQLHTVTFAFTFDLDGLAARWQGREQVASR